MTISFMDAPETSFMDAPEAQDGPPRGSQEARSKTTMGNEKGGRGAPTDHPLKKSDGIWDRDKLCRYVFDVIKTTTITIDELFKYENGYIDEDGVAWPLCSKRSFGKFLADEPDLYKEFSEIKGLRGDLLADEALSVARNRSYDLYDDFDKNGSPIRRVNTSAVSRDNLLVNTLMRLAGVYNPRYNPKQQMEHSGEVGFKELVDRVSGEGVEDLDSIKGQFND
jgi:hypothetical protein